MKIISSKKFDKLFSKLPQKIQKKFFDKIAVFKDDKFSAILNNHKLHGKYNGCFSINITGDLRATYTTPEDEVYYFVAIGTHSELYE